MKQDYSIPELIQNSSFRRVVTGAASLEEIAYWDRWMEEKDVNKQKVQKAIPEIIGFAIKQPQQPDIAREWDELQKSTTNITFHRPNRPSKNQSLILIYRIAAVLLLGALLGLGFYTYSGNSPSSVHLEQITEKRTVQTGADEQKTVTFSNGSKVVLNSSSNITYEITSLQQKSIRIVLEGEAYFEAESVAEQTEPVFAVITPDGVIRDIGTEFLVTVQKDRSRVVLQEGKVEVNSRDQNNSSVTTSVEKDEMLEFDRTEVLSKTKVNPTLYTSWATGAMSFRETTIREFSGFVEERFDVEVRIVEPDLGGIKMDGGIYFESLEELVRSISEVTKVPVYQSENRKTIYIGDGDEYIH